MKSAALTLLFCSAAFAQTPPADDLTKLQNELARDRKTLADWPALGRYAEANAKLAPPAAGETRVVFMGDSITDAWIRLSAKYFEGTGHIDRGISGQTTPQMLIRFRPDVIALKPKVVVILAGTNDIAGNTGPETLEQIESDYASLADLARANGIRVVFSSVMPINYDSGPNALKFFLQRSPDKILALDVWLKKYCADHRLVYLDYFSAMADERGLLKRGLSEDGLHPNAAGFAVMAPLAQAAIEKALAGPAAQ